MGRWLSNHQPIPPSLINFLVFLGWVIIYPNGSRWAFGPAPLKVTQNRKSPIMVLCTAPEFRGSFLDWFDCQRTVKDRLFKNLQIIFNSHPGQFMSEIRVTTSSCSICLNPFSMSMAAINVDHGFFKSWINHIIFCTSIRLLMTACPFIPPNWSGYRLSST